MTARSLDSEVKYQNPNKVINYGTFNNKLDGKTDVNFIKEIMKKEVKHLPFYKNKKVLKTLAFTQVALLSALIISEPSLALATDVMEVNSSLMSELPTPAEVDAFTQWAISTTTKLGVSAGGIVSIIACGLYFHPDPTKSKKAMEMIANAFKGVTNIILIPTIMAIIFLTAQYLLGDLPFFHLRF